MMTRKIAIIGGMSLLAFCPMTSWADPPARPAGLTVPQFKHLQTLQTQPEHATVLELKASYQSEREKNLEMTRLSDDIFTVAWTGGFPLIIILLLIAAAPL